jgi:hypothetical protein
VDDKLKEWGRTFQALAARYSANPILPAKTGPRPWMDWDACLTSAAAAREFRQQYFRAFMQDWKPAVK